MEKELVSKRKIICIVVGLLVIFSTFTSLIITEKVKGMQQNQIQTNPLNLSYIWEQTTNLSNVIYKYPHGYIPKGRAFGSWGANYSYKYLKDQMELINLSTGFQNIQHINSLKYILKSYTSIINVTDFQLQVYDSTGHYPYSHFVPKNESFVIPQAYPWNNTLTFDNISVIPINLTKGILNSLWQLVGFDYKIITDHCFRNRKVSFAGNLTVLNENDSAPDEDDQYNKIFLINESASTQNQLDNLTEASGCIIVEKGGIYPIDTSNCSFSVAYLSNTAGTTIRNLLFQHPDIIAIMEEGILALIYDFESKVNSDYVVIDRIPGHIEIRNIYNDTHIMSYPGLLNIQGTGVNYYLFKYQSFAIILHLICQVLSNQPQCKCFILYSSYDQHFMIPAQYKWDQLIKRGITPSFPTFTVNNSVGENITYNPTHIAITGQVHQELEKETSNTVGVTAKNVWGNITIPSNPLHKRAIISNRYDGWWGQTPGDSGLGAGIVLGIANYIKENGIIPKYDTTFLFTTGEEYGKRGAYYYTDTHNDDNITFWLVLDELGFNQSDTIQELSINEDSNNGSVFRALVNDSYFTERTGLKNDNHTGAIPGTEQDVYSNQFGTGNNIICFAGDKMYEWDGYHSTGDDYTKGDSMQNENKTYASISAELAWNITKYFLLNPNCRFDGPISYTAVDSPNDTNALNDSINATFTVKTSLPVDKVRVNATLKTYPYNQTKFWKNFDFYATSQGTQHTITVTLPPTMQVGNYSLYLKLYNSTGRIDEIVSSGRSNGTVFQGNHVTLHPRGNVNPNKPNDIQGPRDLKALEKGTFNTSDTDSNYDQMQYYWNWGSDNDSVGPYPSGALCSIDHTFVLKGNKTIKVKTREDYYGELYDGPIAGMLSYRFGDWSQWSNPFYVNVTPLILLNMACTPLASAQSMLLSTLPSVLNIDSMYEAFVYGDNEPLTYNWIFNNNRYAYHENKVNYSFDQTGIKTVTLDVSDDDGCIGQISANVSIVNLSASYNFSLLSPYTLPGETIIFNDTSAVRSDRHFTNWTWDFGDETFCYTRNATHSYDYPGFYSVSLAVTNNKSETDTWSIQIGVGYDDCPPEINEVDNSPEVLGMGFDVSIMANVTDNGTGVKSVHVNVTYPDNSSVNYTMTHVMNGTYFFDFNDTWQNGVYHYIIWAIDYANNTNSASGFNFTVTSNATISIATLKDSYGTNQYINITDPPNPPENLTLVGRGLTWNTYYNASSGCNILETYPGPVNYQVDNGSWAPINDSLVMLPSNHPAYPYGYRMGNDRGLIGVYFKPDLSGAWPVAFIYNRSDNLTTFAVRSKLMGVGYVDPADNWLFQNLQNTQNSQAQTMGNTVTYPGAFTGTDVAWSYRGTELKEAITLSNTTKTLLQNHPPSSYGLHDASSYLVFVTKLDCQSLNVWNDSGVLSGNVTITEKGVEFRDALGQFRCALPLGEAYQMSDVSVRQPLTLRIVHLNGETYVLSGFKVSDAVRMTFPIVIDPTLTVTSLSNDGFIWKSDRTYNTAWTYPSGTVDSTSTYLSIGQKLSSSVYYIYRGFVLFDTSSLPSNAYLDSTVLSLYKKDDFSTTDFLLTIQNGQPVCPHNPLLATDYNKVLYSGNGGSLSTANFVNGRNNITLSNLAWINRTGLTKLVLRSSRDINGTVPTGNEYVNVYSTNAPLQSEVPKLIIIYRNQSKIKNTGSTAIKGYLLIQVQYYNINQGKWLVEDDTINETFARTINASQQLPLDTIFNGQVRTSDLKHNQSNYRVYAAFRDPDHAILRTNDGRELVAWWQFIGPQTG